MEKQYQAYLVRFTRSDDRSRWRIMLQNARNGEQHHFVSEKEFFLFLIERLTISNHSSAEVNNSLDQIFNKFL